MTTRPKKSAWQLDREIAEALVAAKSREAAPATILRTRLSRGLGSIIRRTQMAMLDAIKNEPNGSFTFESSNGGVIRAFWKKLADVYYHPPSGAGGHAISQAAGKKLAELWPIVKASWPEAMSE